MCKRRFVQFVEQNQAQPRERPEAAIRKHVAIAVTGTSPAVWKHVSWY